ncbi:MAG: two-component sensor histidine kinase [Desulfobacteraceae bacterium]|nr:two-component sensor histidine kinase [Desulfobacteraceae bacterium]MBC2755036.1 two-component sensor histidine kinase [Desulfobacteraceae bacterium]
MEKLQKLFNPNFLWGGKQGKGPRYRHMFNYSRLWRSAVMLTALSAILPLLAISWFDYNVTRKAVESEALSRTSRTVSNTKRTISAFLTERKSALDFIVHDNIYEELIDPVRLAVILENLRKAFGGISDIGVIDAGGQQIAYIGPYLLEGKNYSDQDWFKEVVERGIYISDVFLGFRNEPHLVIAISYELPDGSFYLLRTSIDTDRLNEQLLTLELGAQGDAFIINTKGVLQTPSRHHEKVFEKIAIPVPEHSPKTEAFEYKDPYEATYILGYAYIPDTPFILMIVKNQNEIMKSWHKTRIEILIFLSIGIIIVMAGVIGFATFFVNNIFIADQRRIKTLHQVEYSNKLASIGRLAAGVAHEINNPLAIINEKSGLIKDIFQLRDTYAKDEKLIGLVDAIHASVVRCGAITKQLLSFSRHMDFSFQLVDLKKIIQEVFGFLGREAEYRNIIISINVSEDVPQFESDRGKLQQIFLNLLNNAFAALSDGGNLDISAILLRDECVRITVEDNGCGIPKKDLKKIFEPFFSTRANVGGTGLGLSITYSLIQEIGGTVDVNSTVDVGTRFIITLPLNAKNIKEKK